MSESPRPNHPLPTDPLWQCLLDGDPGPAVAFFDTLMDADFAFAAGGFLRDLAERIGDAVEFVDDQQRVLFVDTVHVVIRHCMQDDQEAIELLMRETKES